MSPAIPVLFRITSQAEPRFMHQSRRLEGLARLLLGHFVRRQSAQFLVHQWQQFLGSLPIPLLHAF
jgi:hypothetical protein